MSQIISYPKGYRKKDNFNIIGIDEVGRGSLAGPLVVAATLMPHNIRFNGIKDSKQLSYKKREHYALLIKQNAISIGIGWIDHKKIDKYGLTKAQKIGAQKALENLTCKIDFIILDGKYNYLTKKYLSIAIINADKYYLPVTCASIIAKTSRDRYMKKQHQLYPEYEFNNNVGYGTYNHRVRIADKASPIHRHSFAPLKKYLHEEK